MRCRRSLLSTMLMTLLTTSSIAAAPLAILWDDAHDKVTFPLENPPDELSGHYSEFVAIVTGEGHSITELDGVPGALTAATLAAYDVLMIFDAEQPLLPAEITAIQDFVTAGGMVFINGDRPLAFDGASHNTLLAPYGVTFTTDDFLEPCSPPAIPCNVDPARDLTVFNPDPLTAGLTVVDFFSSGALAVAGAGTKVLGTTGLGAVGYAYGAGGAVVVLADSDPLTNSLLSPGNGGETLVENLLAHFAAMANDSIEVTIDIKPGSVVNSVNPDSNGVVPVAILTIGTADGDAIDFDPWDSIDVTTIAFGPGLAAPDHEPAAEDVDFDGDLDMLLHFRTRETGVQCGDTELGLTAQTFEAETVIGTDSITTPGCESSDEP
jgi:hypothetical protein